MINFTKKWAPYLGIAGSVIVPTLVIAQQQRNPPADGTFAPQTLLRAADLEQLRDALADTIARVDRLQANTGVVLSKENIVQPLPENFVSIPPGMRATATAQCPDVNDIAINCICGGDTGPGTGGSPLVDLRIFQTINDVGARSRCDCIGENVGTLTTQRIVARVTCLRP